MRNIRLLTLIGFLFSILLPVSSAHSAELRCLWKWRIKPAQEATRGTLSIKSGKSCLTRHIGHLRDSRYVFHGIKINKQPKNGRFTRVGQLGIRFVPNPGFHGKDEADITVILRGAATNQLYPTVIKTKIKVRK